METLALPQLQSNSVVVGFDVHKYMHLGVAVDMFGKELDFLECSNQTLNQAVTWLTQLSTQSPLIVGIEDVHGYGYRLAKTLVEHGFTVRFSPAHLTDTERHHSAYKDKTDHLDAKRVAQVILHKMEETLPADPIVTEDQATLRTLDLFLQERASLVREQTGLKNQLHLLLHQYYGDTYKQEFGSIFGKRALTWYQQDLRQNQKKDLEAYVGAAILRRLERLLLIKAQIQELGKSIEAVSRQVTAVQKLKTHFSGCGTLTATKIMVEIKTIHRFASASKLARYGGFAPVTYQSSRRGRRCADMGGNRRLNQAVHVIALSHIGGAKIASSCTYYHKKIKEGKTKLWAIRCLKRQLINQIYQVLNISEEGGLHNRLN